MNCPSCQAANEREAATCGRCGGALPQVPTEVVIAIDLRPGSVFHGRYEILAPLGQGGMGMVYKARDRSLDEVVAIKVLRPDFAQDPRMAERFKTEIRLARRIRHKNVCAIHDYGEDRGLLYISMEFIEGVDLKHLLREKGAFPAAEAYDIAIQLAEGLQAVHEAGIIHRDLKTPNIMRDERGVARLMDFGIAKRQGGETVTATGHIIGTPEYMSPEQAQGQRVDFRSDVYALGIVTYEIFSGRVPFRGETPISTILKHLHDPPPLDGPEARGIPVDLRSVLRRCLAKDPNERYASAAEFADALRNARSPSRRQQPMPTVALNAPTLPAAVTRPAPVAPPRKAMSRRLLQPWLLALPVLASAAGVVALKHRGTEAGVGPAPSPAATPSGTSAVPTTLLAVVPTTLIAAASTLAATLPPATLPSATLPLPAPRRPIAAVVRPSIGSRGPSPATTTRPILPLVPVTTAPPTPATIVPTPTSTEPEGRSTEPGLLQVAVKPWGEVTVDGKLLGTTPLDRIPLAAGTHHVRIRHPLYEVWERQVAIRAGQVEKIVVDFPAQGVRKP